MAPASARAAPTRLPLTPGPLLRGNRKRPPSDLTVGGGPQYKPGLLGTTLAAGPEGVSVTWTKDGLGGRVALTLLVLGAALSSSVLAEDVEKKWRLSLAVGGFTANDEVASNAGNEFIVADREAFDQGNIEAFALFRDPRNDSSVFGSLKIRSAQLSTLAVQYALSKTFLLEGSIGYETADVGDIEVAVQFDGSHPPIEEVAFTFETFHIPAGELTRVPVQLDGLLRLRPRAKFNPYFGAGIGYSFVGFDPSPRLNQLSFDMDGSVASACRLSSELTANAQLTCQGAPRDLLGASLSARDTFEYNFVAGAELALKRRMSVFIDLRWVAASRQFEIGFDGKSELGVSVPNLLDFDDSVAALTDYGPVNVGNGGLIDGGVRRRLPQPTVATNICHDPFSPECADFCIQNSNQCFLGFVPSPGSGREIIDSDTGEVYTDTDPGPGDGRNDRGLYYVQGGKLAYDGYALQIGFRYTF